VARPRTDDTRNRAIEAADALLHERGYMGVSMDDIAKQIGIRKASLYHHFPDGKDQIVMALGERLIEFDARGLEAALQHANVRDRLEAMARFIFQDTRQTNAVLRDAVRFMATEHQRRIAALFFNRMFAPVQAAFEAGISSSELKPHDTRFATFSFLSLLSEMNAPEHQAAFSNLPNRVTALLLEGLQTERKPS
jgi:AcrR family transcriptional regulator